MIFVTWVAPHRYFRFFRLLFCHEVAYATEQRKPGDAMTSALEQHTVLPPADADAGFREALRALRSVLGNQTSEEAHTRVVGPNGAAELPAAVFEVLRQVVVAMSQGLAINIAPRHAVLTTQEAADMLNISRPTLVKLLESGEIPFEQPGRHRKVRLEDVLDYQQRARHRRRASLNEMTARAIEDESDVEADNVDRIIQTR
ncbi:helix-turn-helix domain-containing protein [Amycolatopsis sp. NPDC051758]|uniref:helix-turn-helix domain-containing protein n=1 Tax=Amycolatopsis sp. NPDC051758 TaxID=3363935 RepID=UPI0037AB222A